MFVLSYPFWRDFLGADPHVLGQSDPAKRQNLHSDRRELLGNIPTIMKPKTSAKLSR